MEKDTEESPVERAKTAAAWGLMLWDQTCKALNEETGDSSFAERHPQVVGMCMQAGSMQQLMRAMNELREAVDRRE